MAAKKKITVEIDADTLKKLIATADALSELAGAWATGVDDPGIKAHAKKSAKKRAK